MQIELRSIQRKVGTTTILVTHDQSEAMAMSDRIAVMNEGRLAQVDQPYKAYEHPGDSFVTQFLGKSNVFAGTVSTVNGSATAIDVSGIEFKASSNAFEQGAPVNVSVRPEKVRLVKADQGLLNGKIHARIFLGNHWVFQIDTEIGEIIAIAQNTGYQAMDEGQKIGLEWSPEEVRVLLREAD